MYQKLKELILAQGGLSADQISFADPLSKNLAFNSLDRNNLMDSIMDLFNISIPNEYYNGLDTIEDSMRCISNKQTISDADRALACTEFVLALFAAANEFLPTKANYSKEYFYPLNKVQSYEELVWTLNYVVETYENRVRANSKEGEKYILIVDPVPAGHPVFLLATLYVLLVAGADIYVRYAKDDTILYNRILNTLVQKDVIHHFEPENPYSNQEIVNYITENDISHLVFLGGAANTHHTFYIVNNSEATSVHYPSNHLLLVDYKNNTEYSDAADRFGDKCWEELIDYDGYPAPTHNEEGVDFYVGFDYDSLFWGADYIIDSWNDILGMNEKIPAIIFTDRPRDQVWLPKGIEKCCNVTFIEDYDSNYPLYDFMQLLK